MIGLRSGGGTPTAGGRPADGILKMAQQNATSTITSLLQAWGLRRLISTDDQLN
jgi:hypothetical protein